MVGFTAMMPACHHDVSECLTFVRWGGTQSFAEQLKGDGEQLMFQNLIPMTVHLKQAAAVA
eukprot:COSAG01_NODE_10706_length_2099_cov_2.936000_1_plen_60_part_10